MIRKQRNLISDRAFSQTKGLHSCPARVARMLYEPEKNRLHPTEQTPTALESLAYWFQKSSDGLLPQLQQQVAVVYPKGSLVSGVTNVFVITRQTQPDVKLN